MSSDSARVVWLASARARLCFEALGAGEALGARVVGLVSDRRCKALSRAEREGLAHELVEPAEDEPREAYCRRLAEAVERLSPDLLFSQFHLLLSPAFVRDYRNRIINAHNGLLPAFAGFGGHTAALRAGVRFAGATVHYVDEGTDTGPIIAQSVVPVAPDDTPKALAERLWPHLRRAALSAVKWHVAGRIAVEGRRAVVRGADYAGYPTCPTPEVA